MRRRDDRRAALTARCLATIKDDIDTGVGHDSHARFARHGHPHLPQRCDEVSQRSRRRNLRVPGLRLRDHARLSVTPPICKSERTRATRRRRYLAASDIMPKSLANPDVRDEMLDRLESLSPDA